MWAFSPRGFLLGPLCNLDLLAAGELAGWYRSQFRKINIEGGVEYEARGTAAGGGGRRVGAAAR